MVVNLLERFGGYTYSSLLAEDSELLRLVGMVDEERSLTEDAE